jgi:hypothetical protein
MGPYAPIAVLIVSISFMIALVYNSFTNQRLQFGGAEISAYFLTNRSSFRWGLFVYFSLVMLLYSVVTYYWGPLSNITSPLLKDTQFQKFVGSGNTAPDAVIPLIVAMSAAGLLGWDAKYNPFGIILQFVHDLIRIPDRARTTLEELRFAKFRRLEPEEAALIAGDDEILECDKAYFALDRKTLEYRWAHLCHLRYLLMKYFREPGPGASETIRARRRQGAKIITALEWGQLDRSYRQLAPRLAAWRRGPDKDPSDAIDIFSEISELKEKHYRVLACLLVCLAGNEREILEQLGRLSDSPVTPIPGNFSLYISLFCANLFFSILVGREVAIAFYQKFIGSSDRIQSFDIERLKFWFLVSLIIFVIPIALMTLFRWLMRARLPFKKERHWNIYVFFALLAFAMAVLVLPELTYGKPRPAWFSEDYLVGMWGAFLWGVFPCFLTGMIGYRLDSPASCADSRRVVLLDRAGVALICAAAGGLFSLLAARGATTLTFAEGFVVVVTMALVGGTVGWMSRFRSPGSIEHFTPNDAPVGRAESRLFLAR